MALTFVKPDISRLSLPDGDWIEVKRELTAGDERRMFAEQIKGYENGKAVYDPEKVGIATVMAYLIGWSLPVPLTLDAVNNLTPDSYRVIADAVNAHIEAVDTAHAKNSSDGKGVSASTSPSVNV